MKIHCSPRIAVRNVVGLSLFLALALSCAGGQSLTGKWYSPGRTLDSGENDSIVFDLTQSGDAVTGSMRDLGSRAEVKGTVHGTHVELFRNNGSKPTWTGEIVGSELHLSQGNRQFVARAATAEDVFPELPYVEPPALHDVPSNGMAKTPPMGWNSWNLFGRTIDDKIVRGIADAMVTSGMRDAGYIYINIDDTWEGVRDAQGNITSNKKFPDMKALADYVHARGLKLGIYSSPGPRTCAHYIGSYQHEDQDAKTFAAWGVDYLKYDWCAASLVYSKDKLQPVYQTMGDALLHSGRPILYSLCEYGDGNVETWGAKVGGNLWRTTGDIRDSWDSMISNVEKQVPTARFAGPGHWNDPDMLEIGNGHMTADEYRVHMGLWALSAAPLLAGNDIRSMTEETKAILMNREVIAVDQDALGKQATPVRSGELETWVKPLANGDVAVGIVNFGASQTQATFKLAEVGVKSASAARDLFAHHDVKFTDGMYTTVVPSHGIVLLRVVRGAATK